MNEPHKEMTNPSEGNERAPRALEHGGRSESEAGGLVQSGSRFVSCRACVRAVLDYWDSGQTDSSWVFPFPFWLARLYFVRFSD